MKRNKEKQIKPKENQKKGRVHNNHVVCFPLTISSYVDANTALANILHMLFTCCSDVLFSELPFRSFSALAEVSHSLVDVVAPVVSLLHTYPFPLPLSPPLSPPLGTGFVIRAHASYSIFLAKMPPASFSDAILMLKFYLHPSSLIFD